MGTLWSHLTAATLTSMINSYVCLNNNSCFNDTVAGVIKGMQVLRFRGTATGWKPGWVSRVAMWNTLKVEAEWNQALSHRTTWTSRNVELFTRETLCKLALICGALILQANVCFHCGHFPKHAINNQSSWLPVNHSFSSFQWIYYKSAVLVL